MTAQIQQINTKLMADVDSFWIIYNCIQKNTPRTIDSENVRIVRYTKQSTNYPFDFSAPIIFNFASICDKKCDKHTNLSFFLFISHLFCVMKHNFDAFFICCSSSNRVMRQSKIATTAIDAAAIFVATN